MRFESYEEFYRYYLTQHSRPWTRRLHAVGTLVGPGFVVYFLVVGPAWLAPLGVAVGYTFAWGSHWLIEGNQPATFGHPWWSFLSDFRMLFETLKRLGRNQ